MASDFLLCIGGSYYTEEAFRNEARTLGVSRRISRIPPDLVPGESRIYCVFGAGKTGFRRKCEACGGACKVDKEVAPHLRNSKCTACGVEFDPTSNAARGRISCYFVPSAVEICLKANDEQTQEIMQQCHNSGWLNLTWDRTAEHARAYLTVTNEPTAEVVKDLVDRHHVLAEVINLQAELQGRITRYAYLYREPQRGCGFRHHGGIYVVVDPAGTVLHDVGPVTYNGEHFRSLHRLNEENTMALRQGTYGPITPHAA